jgi:glyoxylase I family protein
VGLKTHAAKAANIDGEGNLAQLQGVRDARRGHNKIRRLHHHAVRTDDMEATRRFYEDLIGLPMVAAMKESLDHTSGQPTPFLHCFFELGDGSSLAFFQFLPGAYGPATNLPRDGIDHHIALSVPDFDDIVRLKARLDEHGYRTCGMNHGFCYSLYVRDPNGMLLELVGDAPNELELNETAATGAHRELEKWNEKDYAPNNRERGKVEYPLPTSPVEDIMAVVR